MKRLLLISRGETEPEGRHILELAAWMGVQTTALTLDARPSPDQLAANLGTDACMVVSLETLAGLHDLWPAGALRQLLEDHCAQALVFSTGTPQPAAIDLLHSLSCGAISGMNPPAQPQVYRFPETARSLSGPFAGQQFTLAQQPTISTYRLVRTASAGTDPGHGVPGSPGDNHITDILLAGTAPVFLRVSGGRCEVFLLSVTQVPNIAEELSPGKGIEDRYDGLIPLLIFLRHCFGDRCWHGINTTGRLIIDDPLLRSTYGYLDFSALRRSMRSADYGTTVAFIPWNHWRTSKKEAMPLFGASPDLSICVHGCDHTNKEFEDTDPGSLRWKTDTALERMTRQQERTGVAFEPVMVFPQGRFASPAISALRASGYLAAVNTSCFPSDAEARPLRIADFLRPAITAYDGFPIFPRRYPRRLIDFAFDAFIGRPLLIVQHHDDFRDGYETMERFIAGLHDIAPDITWGLLADQLKQSCLLRSISERELEVRFFTGQFEFKNAAPGPMRVIFSKDEPRLSAISGVTVNGTSVPFSTENGLLLFEHQVDAGQTIDIRVVESATPSARKPPAPTHTIGVSVRRALSEFRDNTLVRYPRFLAAATQVAGRMKMTGQDGSGRS